MPPVIALLFFLLLQDPMEVHKDLRYAEIEHVDPEFTSLDLYAPAKARRAPVMVFVHGGGWQSGDRSNVRHKPGYFVDAGYVFASVNYRLVPDVEYPRNVQDVARALAWIHSNVAEYGGDPDQIYLLGHSAGAHLAGLVATDARRLKASGKDLSILKGVVLLDSSAYDIPSVMKLRGGGRTDVYEKAFGGDPKVWKDASPITHVARGRHIPPFLLIHANTWRPKKLQAERLAAALKKAGVRADVLAAPGKTHMTLNRDFGKSGDGPTAAVRQFLDSLRASETDERIVRQAPYALDPDEHRIGRQIENLSFTDIEGKRGRLSDFKERAALVIALTDTTCPVTKRYRPSLARLEKQYGDKDVAFLFVNMNAAETVDQIKGHGFKSRYVHDPKSAFGHALGALTTTDVFVLDASRTLIYRGAVDDQYGFGYAKEAPSERYVIRALEAVLAGKEPKVAATWAPGCVLDLKDPEEEPRELTYHNRISRIVDRHCVQCHRKGGVAPFRLDSYEAVKARRGMIRFVLKKGIMPPWFAAPGSGPWENDRSLPGEDKRDLLDWTRAGMAEGDPADAPRARTFRDEWEIGEPDFIAQIPRPFTVKAEGVMPYKYVRVPTNFTEDRWVRAIEIRPTAREVVHHVLVFAQVEGRRFEEDTPLRRRRRGGAGRGFFAGYVPGNSRRVYADGLAKRLPAGATLLFQIHYTPNGTATRDQVKLGLIFSKSKPKHEVFNNGIANTRFAIPPNDPNHAVSASLRVPTRVKLLSLMPHMHTRGKAFRFDLIWREGEPQRLLDVPHYDFNWQLTYVFAEPVTVGPGSRLKVTGWYDNSNENPANPDPEKTVRWGDQTFDEMLLGYLEYYVPE